MIGLFGKYSTKFERNSVGTLNSTNRDFNIDIGGFNQYLNVPFTHEYDPSNGGSAPAQQNLINATIISYNGDFRALANAVSTTTGSGLIDPTIPVSNNLIRFRYNSTGALTKLIVNRFMRPDLIFTFSNKITTNNLGLSGTVSIPYLINCKHIYIEDAANITALNIQFSNLLSFVLRSSTSLNSINNKLPATLTTLELTGSATLGVIATINTLISDCMNMVNLMFCNDSSLNNSASTNVPLQAGTLDISHMAALKCLQIMTSPLLTDITFNSSITLEILIIQSSTGISATTFKSLFEKFLADSGQKFTSIHSSQNSVWKSMVDADFKSTLQKFYIYENYFVGYLTLTTSKTVCTDFALGATATSITNASTGKNATANSATAGAATIENGGAGGAGGSNNNGATASNYGGGGGGSGRTSGTRLGGAGANGFIRISYTTGGVFTQQTFTSSSSFSTPSDVSQMVIECWGAGGSGGTRGSVTGASGGGGGGAYAIKRLTVSPSTSYNYTVGVGGAAGSGTVVADGFDGGDTYWDAGAAVKAAGGKKGLGTQTGGLGGAIADCVGDSVFAGGNGSTKTTNGSPGGGGGGAAGSTGLKNNFPIVDVTGLTHATTIDLSNSQIVIIELPVNTVCQNLYIGGNKLDVTVNTNLISQILAMSALVNLSLSTGNTSSFNSIEFGQVGGGFGSNLDLSSLTNLTDLIASTGIISGLLKLPPSIEVLAISANPSLTGIDTGSLSNLSFIRATDSTTFDFDFTRCININGFVMRNSGLTVLNLSSKVGNFGSGGFDAAFCANLTTITLPTTSFTIPISVSFNIVGCPLLTSISNLENWSVTGASRVAQLSGCSLNQDLKIGYNTCIPGQITIQDNGMSVANVDVNLWNIINNRTKWNVITGSKTLNIAGTNGTPTGTYAAPTGYRTHAALTITAVTKAAVGVVTVSAIGTVANGDVVYIYDATGMTELNGNYYRVSNISGNTFELETPAGVDVDTTTYGTYTGSAGRCRPDGDLSGGTDTKAGTYVLVTQYAWTITQN